MTTLHHPNAHLPPFVPEGRETDPEHLTVPRLCLASSPMTKHFKDKLRVGSSDCRRGFENQYHYREPEENSACLRTRSSISKQRLDRGRFEEDADTGMPSFDGETALLNINEPAASEPMKMSVLLIQAEQVDGITLETMNRSMQSETQACERSTQTRKESIQYTGKQDQFAQTDDSKEIIEIHDSIIVIDDSVATDHSPEENGDDSVIILETPEYAPKPAIQRFGRGAEGSSKNQLQPNEATRGSVHKRTYPPESLAPQKLPTSEAESDSWVSFQSAFSSVPWKDSETSISIQTASETRSDADACLSLVSPATEMYKTPAEKPLSVIQNPFATTEASDESSLFTPAPVYPKRAFQAMENQQFSSTPNHANSVSSQSRSFGSLSDSAPSLSFFTSEEESESSPVCHVFGPVYWERCTSDCETQEKRYFDVSGSDDDDFADDSEILSRHKMTMKENRPCFQSQYQGLVAKRGWRPSANVHKGSPPELKVLCKSFLGLDVSDSVLSIQFDTEHDRPEMSPRTTDISKQKTTTGQTLQGLKTFLEQDCHMESKMDDQKALILPEMETVRSDLNSTDAEDTPADIFQDSAQSKRSLQEVEESKQSLQAVGEFEQSFKAVEESEQSLQAVEESQQSLQAVEESQQSLQAVEDSQQSLQSADETEYTSSMRTQLNDAGNPLHRPDSKALHKVTDSLFPHSSVDLNDDLSVDSLFSDCENSSTDLFSTPNLSGLSSDKKSKSNSGVFFSEDITAEPPSRSPAGPGLTNDSDRTADYNPSKQIASPDAVKTRGAAGGEVEDRGKGGNREEDRRERDEGRKEENRDGGDARKDGQEGGGGRGGGRQNGDENGERKRNGGGGGGRGRRGGGGGDGDTSDVDIDVDKVRSYVVHVIRMAQLRFMSLSEASRKQPSGGEDNFEDDFEDAAMFQHTVGTNRRDSQQAVGPRDQEADKNSQDSSTDKLTELDSEDDTREPATPSEDRQIDHQNISAKTLDPSEYLTSDDSGPDSALNIPLDLKQRTTTTSGDYLKKHGYDDTDNFRHNLSDEFETPEKARFSYNLDRSFGNISLSSVNSSVLIGSEKKKASSLDDDSLLTLEQLELQHNLEDEGEVVHASLETSLEPRMCPVASPVLDLARVNTPPTFNLELMNVSPPSGYMSTIPSSYDGHELMTETERLAEGTSNNAVATEMRKVDSGSTECLFEEASSLNYRVPTILRKDESGNTECLVEEASSLNDAVSGAMRQDEAGTPQRPQTPKPPCNEGELLLPPPLDVTVSSSLMRTPAKNTGHDIPLETPRTPVPRNKHRHSTSGQSSLALRPAILKSYSTTDAGTKTKRNRPPLRTSKSVTGLYWSCRETLPHISDINLSPLFELPRRKSSTTSLEGDSTVRRLALAVDDSAGTMQRNRRLRETKGKLGPRRKEGGLESTVISPQEVVFVRSPRQPGSIQPRKMSHHSLRGSLPGPQNSLSSGQEEEDEGVSLAELGYDEDDDDDLFTPPMTQHVQLSTSAKGQSASFAIKPPRRSLDFSVEPEAGAESTSLEEIGQFRQSFLPKHATEEISTDETGCRKLEADAGEPSEKQDDVEKQSGKSDAQTVGTLKDAKKMSECSEKRRGLFKQSTTSSFVFNAAEYLNKLIKSKLTPSQENVTPAIPVDSPDVPSTPSHTPCTPLTPSNTSVDSVTFGHSSNTTRGYTNFDTLASSQPRSTSRTSLTPSQTSMDSGTSDYSLNTALLRRYTPTDPPVPSRPQNTSLTPSQASMDSVTSEYSPNTALARSYTHSTPPAPRSRWLTSSSTSNVSSNPRRVCSVSTHPSHLSPASSYPPAVKTAGMVQTVNASMETENPAQGPLSPGILKSTQSSTEKTGKLRDSQREGFGNVFAGKEPVQTFARTPCRGKGNAGDSRKLLLEEFMARETSERRLHYATLLAKFEEASTKGSPPLSPKVVPPWKKGREKSDPESFNSGAARPKAAAEPSSESEESLAFEPECKAQQKAFTDGSAKTAKQDAPTEPHPTTEHSSITSPYWKPNTEVVVSSPATAEKDILPETGSASNKASLLSPEWNLKREAIAKTSVPTAERSSTSTPENQKEPEEPPTLSPDEKATHETNTESIVTTATQKTLAEPGPLIDKSLTLCPEWKSKTEDTVESSSTTANQEASTGPKWSPEELPDLFPEWKLQTENTVTAAKQETSTGSKRSTKESPTLFPGWKPKTEDRMQDTPLSRTCRRVSVVNVSGRRLTAYSPGVQGLLSSAVVQSVLEPLASLRGKSATARPLYIVHPVTGCVEILKELASGLDVRCFGIKKTDHAQDFSVETLARFYCQAITHQDSLGTYRLAGYSYGGMVAFEMARQMQRAGKTVELLIMLDGSPDYVRCQTQFPRRHLAADVSPERATAVVETHFLLYIMNMYGPVEQRGLVKMMLEEQDTQEQRVEAAIGVTMGTVKVSANVARSRWLSLKSKVDLGKLGGGGKVKVAVSRVADDLISLKRQQKAMKFLKAIYIADNYDASDAELFQGDIHLVRIKTTPEYSCLLSADYGLGKLCTGKAKIQYVEGEHESMMRAPHVRSVIGAVKEILRGSSQ